MATPLYLTTAQLADALYRLENVRVPIRTIASWAATNLLVPSVDWRRDAQGRGIRRAPRLYSMRDLTRARLIARLRQHLSKPRVRVVLAALDASGDMKELFRRDSRMVLRYNNWRAEVVVEKPGEARSIPDGQLYLPLVMFTRGNETVARQVRKVAAA